MFNVGVHVSIAGSIDLAVYRAFCKGCTAFQIFTSNPRRWLNQPLSREEINRFRDKVSTIGFKFIVAHMPYLPNLASPRDGVYRKSKEKLKLELARCSDLDISYLVTHLGSHLGKGKDKGFKRIIAALNECLTEDEGKVTILLENTAGTKNSMGATFQEIRYIIKMVTSSDRIGVCFDTSHAFAAGYDLRSKEAVKSTFESFNRLVGIDSLKLIHLNDSRGDLGSHIDRHEHIGMGKIGREGFKALISYNRFKYLPFILETPIDDRRSDLENLEEVKKIASEIGVE